ncbi:MAG: DUF4363 family protein [Oscillospiraceae bacterium]|jgi:hypothetical protein|nr:DUF4363 family protein [Oscillospiraceae bacterium]
MRIRLIAAICLLVFALGAALGFAAFLEHAAKELETALTTALEDALTESPGWETATQEVTRLWARDKGLMHVLLPHVNLNELEWALGTLPEYQREQEATLYVEQCVRGIQCIRTIREMERPTIGNIF